ncbi:MAG TPA: PilZ domain-containing protein [Candidatus Sulfotelmatobacter sp.]|nr:PilZ domain-containing protein [Candidatus Sulfotelmatobacter sp.]
MNVSEEQRRYPRVKPPKSIVAAWQAGTQRGVSFVDSMAIGGLFVRTKERVPLRCLVQILLDLPVGQVRARAIVRRVRNGHGMAVQFIAMGQTDRARLFQQMNVLLTA